MATTPLKVAFLTGSDDQSTRMSIRAVCQLEGIQPVAVLLDTERPEAGRRWRNLKLNLKREGLSYLPYRVLLAIRERLEAMADGIIPADETEALLHRAFPDDSLERLSAIHGFRVVPVTNLNSEAAAQALRETGADLGIVLGTRVLKRSTFSVPRLGSINLHKGKVPDFRGMPPGFWELYTGQTRAGVTVHFVDDGLDTGDIVEEAQIPIHPKDTPDSLRAKLHDLGAATLATAAARLAAGTAARRAQPPSTRKPYRKPTRAQEAELAARLPHWTRVNALAHTVKLFVWLVIFYSGLFSLIRWFRRGSTRGAILLYHRVNDFADDVLTVNTHRFAQHLVTLRHFYKPVATEVIVDGVVSGKQLDPASVAVHFDDCYRDVRTHGARILAAAGVPATAFISSGFIDTDRVFPHDAEKYPHRFENLRASDVRELPLQGVSVGAHTVNHADLGQATLEQARTEVYESRRDLERILGSPVTLFSFPFGGLENIREEVRQLVAEAGYSALFSAHGGFISADTGPLDIPRFGVSSDHSPLALLMELEGLTPSQLLSRFR